LQQFFTNDSPVLRHILVVHYNNKEKTAMEKEGLANKVFSFVKEPKKIILLSVLSQKTYTLVILCCTLK
jgi:hypothetical protein